MESPPRAPEDDAPRLVDEDEDARGLYSGPTVVDDQKVAEVLKKLRSLDRPPGPLTGVTEAVVDANSSEPTRIDSGAMPGSTPAPAPSSSADAAAGMKATRGPPAWKTSCIRSSGPRRSAAA